MAYDVLKMYNAETGGVGDCTEESFRTIYQFRGWALLGNAEQHAAQLLGRRVGSLDDLSADELKQVAAMTPGVNTKSSKKADLAKAIRGAVPEGPVVVDTISEDTVVDPITGETMSADAYAELVAQRETEGTKS